MLTKEIFDNTHVRGIMSSGITKENLTNEDYGNSRKTFKWIAIKESATSWAMYVGLVNKPTIAIFGTGVKITDNEVIDRFVPSATNIKELYNYN